jgi:hypothetical protein
MIIPQNVIDKILFDFFFHTFVLHPVCVNVPGYYIVSLSNILFDYLFNFSDVIATCFGPLSGHHQAILTQIYKIVYTTIQSVVETSLVIPDKGSKHVAIIPEK